jgi:uncharacterized membrane-anchored protein YitT (DUF2179 family)
MVHCLQEEVGYGVITVNGEGASGAVKLLYTVIKRKDLGSVAEIIHAVNPKAFFSVDEVRLAESGIFPEQTHVAGRKGKRNYFKNAAINSQLLTRS